MVIDSGPNGILDSSPAPTDVVWPAGLATEPHEIRPGADGTLETPVQGDDEMSQVIATGPNKRGQTTSIDCSWRGFNAEVGLISPKIVKTAGKKA